MKTTIILHGTPSKEEYYDPTSESQSNKHWIPWLQRQLGLKDILTQTPELPKPWFPVYANWKKVFEYFPVDEETILVGHSCGAGFLVRWLSENKMNIDKLILVAPWMNKLKHDHDIEPSFFDFEIDQSIINRVKSLHIFVSTDDSEEVLHTVKLLQEQLPDALIHRFDSKGHFTLNDLGTREFPELLQVCLEE